MKKEILNCLTWMMNNISQTTMYSWSDTLKSKHIKESSNELYKSLRKHIDISKLTKEEAEELRFNKWDKDSDLYLFPLWIVPLIPEGINVYTISGECIKYEKDKIDNDIRFGCVAYGIMIKE